MASVNLCSRVDDLYLMLKQSDSGEEMFPDFGLETDESGSDKQVSGTSEAKLPSQDQDALNTLIADSAGIPN